jgi:kynureninase
MFASETAAALDQADPLQALRAEFFIPPGHTRAENIYLCGHSLGLQPRGTAAALAQELADWRELAVNAHFEGQHPWMPYHERATAALARLAGALPLEVVAMNSLTTNLHLMMTSFYRPTPHRYKILIEGPAFPSDRYAVVSQLELHGYDASGLIEAEPGPEGFVSSAQLRDLIAAEGETIALVLLSPVNYTSGALLDIPSLTAQAQAQGCRVGLDLAHTLGNLPLHLHDWNVDFAVWCSYKYLNAGPGGIGGCFVHERHAHSALPRLAGWWGHNKQTRFEMPRQFDPLPGAEGWQLSNPPIFQLAALCSALELFERAGIEALRAKSVRLTGYLESLLQQLPAGLFQQLTPTDPAARGCQLSLRLPQARALQSALEAEGVIADFRAPDILRLAPVPLYNTFSEVCETAEILRKVLT